MKSDNAQADRQFSGQDFIGFPVDPTATHSTPDDGSVAAPPSMSPQRYCFGEEIARGGMGAVYRATDIVFAREVAVKVLQDRFAPTSSTARRFADEARITGQLQHPNIPAVHDLGTLPDGRPFLAMKLIKGETLDELLKFRSDLSADRGRFLAVFEQIAQAVAYAHAHNVIHRDLKPDNVMVGLFGEVQVMDWGLAKVVGTREAERTDPDETTAPTAVQSLRQTDSAYTQAGSVLGTPAYMPPEQAIGAIHKVDARSDVFGLGAILAVILTGKPPFVGSSAETTRLSAARGDLEQCYARLEACGAEPELVALCKRCLSKRAEDRPANAGEVAQAVAALRAAAEQRAKQAEMDRARAETQAIEQGKRRRLAMAAGSGIAAVLLVGLATSLWQMNRAMVAERQAKANEQQALTNAELAQANEAKAIAERDAKAAALQAERAARERTLQSLRSLTNDVVERKFAQGQGHTLSDDDRAFLRSVQQQWEAFAAVGGDDAESRSVRAEGLHRVGLMRHHLEELREAEENYRAAVALRKQLVGDFPSQPNFRLGLAASHLNLGNLLHATGRIEEAEQNHDAALILFKQLVGDHPKQANFRQGLASNSINLGNLLQATGRIEKAEQNYNAALALYQQLAAAFPSQPEFRQGLALSHQNLGNLLRDNGRLKEAEQNYSASLALRKQLATDFPARPEFRHDLAQSHGSLGVLLRDTGRQKEAEQSHRVALALFKQLAAEYPSRPKFRQDLAKSCDNLGHLLRNIGRQKEAEQNYNEVLVLRKQLIADFPTRPEFRNELAGSHINLGNLLHATNRHKEAEQNYNAALTLQRQLAADFPTRPQFRHHLAVGYLNLGNLLRDTGRLKEAEQNYASALTLYKQLASDFPNMSDYQIELGLSCCNLGNLMRDSGKLQESLKWFSEAVSSLHPILKRQPHHPTARQFLRKSYGARAMSHDRLGQFAQAVADWDRVVELSPENEQRYDRLSRATARVRAGQVSEAVAEVAELSKLPGWNAVQWYSFASVYAVASGQVADKKQEYADRALELLQKAIKAGYKDAAQMKQDSDLAPLRDRDDFKTLLAELEKKFPPPKEVAPPPREKK